MARVKAAIIGSGNIGTDLMMKMIKYPQNMELAIVVGIDEKSEGLAMAREHGIEVASSCESGTCGTCKQRLVSGEADHRDMVLLDEEKADHIMVCVSRAKDGALVIDL